MNGLSTLSTGVPTAKRLLQRDLLERSDQLEGRLSWDQKGCCYGLLLSWLGCQYRVLLVGHSNNVSSQLAIQITFFIRE